MLPSPMPQRHSHWGSLENRNFASKGENLPKSMQVSGEAKGQDEGAVLHVATGTHGRFQESPPKRH